MNYHPVNTFMEPIPKERNRISSASRKLACRSFLSHYSCSSPKKITILISVTIYCYFPRTLYINIFVNSVFFSLKTFFVRFFSVVSHDLFLSIDIWSSFVWIYHHLFICSSTDEKSVVFSFGQLQIILLWTFLFMPGCTYIPYLLDVFLEVK